jgi:hypothetical protein
MNTMKTFFAIAVSVGLIGCASTSNDSAPRYPELKVLSDKPYVWDDSASEALNVAQMAQPAGVGIGMMDYPDGTKATTGRIGSGGQLLDAGLGLASQGIFGVVSMGALNHGVNSDLDWKPSIVQLVKNEDGANNSFLALRENIAKNVWDAVSKAGAKVNLIGVGTLKSAHNSTDKKGIYNISLFMNGDECVEARKMEGADGLNMTDAGKHVYDIPLGTTGYCTIHLKLSIAGRTAKNETILVSEFLGGYHFVQYMKHLNDVYVIVPDYYNGLTQKSVFKSPFAYVMKGNEKLLFEKRVN